MTRICRRVCHRPARRPRCPAPALHEHGLKVPDDMAVLGFDDIEDGRYSVPTLSTVAPDKREIARVAVSQLADRLSGDLGRPPRWVEAPFSLLVRESSAARSDEHRSRRGHRRGVKGLLRSAPRVDELEGERAGDQGRAVELGDED